MIDPWSMHNLSWKTLTADNASPLTRIAWQILPIGRRIFLDISISRYLQPRSGLPWYDPHPTPQPPRTGCDWVFDCGAQFPTSLFAEPRSVSHSKDARVSPAVAYIPRPHSGNPIDDSTSVRSSPDSPTCSSFPSCGSAEWVPTFREPFLPGTSTATARE
jgi:hypothetical protein